MKKARSLSGSGLWGELFTVSINGFIREKNRNGCLDVKFF